MTKKSSLKNKYMVRQEIKFGIQWCNFYYLITIETFVNKLKQGLVKHSCIREE